MREILGISIILMLFIIAGLFIYLIISYEQKKRNKFIKSAVETDGIVEGRDLSSIHPFFYRLEYSYLDKHAVKYKVYENMGFAVFKYKKGEKITVYYDPTHPINNMIKINKKRK